MTKHGKLRPDIQAIYSDMIRPSYVGTLSR